MKKVFVTGISGFIGQALEKRLVAEGYEVHGLYEHKKKFAESAGVVEKHYGKLQDYKKIDRLMELIKPNFVIHLAAKTEVALSFDNYREVSEVNYVGTVNLAEANRKFNPNLELFVMATTMETYGYQATKEDVLAGKLPPPVTEDTKQRPRAPYAVAKLACEHYLKYMHFAYNFPFTGFRQTNAYGRPNNDFFVVEQIIHQMIKGKTVSLGAPEPYRNFLYIDDLIDLYMTALKNPEKAKGEIFVTGPDNAISIRDLADKIAQKMGWSGSIAWDIKPPRPGEIYYLNSIGTKAKELLGWEPKVSLDEGLDKTIKIWRDKYVSKESQ